MGNVRFRMNLKEIRKEIIKNIKREHLHLLDKIEDELDILEKTEGIDDKNNLQSFYDIWQQNKDKRGNKNTINSWTAYALGMTIKEPDNHFLPIRRAFARAGFPDIDVDFDDERRNEIYDYLIEKYGRENVGNIGTHGSLNFKSCVTRVTKALDISDAFHKGRDAFITENKAQVDEILRTFPKGGVLKVKGDDGKDHFIKSVNDAYEFSSEFKFYMDKYPEIKKHVEYIEGTFANAGIHAAGIVISDIPLEGIAPLRTARKSMLSTQFVMDELELIGLIKYDILGLSTLSVIKRTLKLIKENYDIDIDRDKLPLDDAKTFKLYQTGNLGGVFQCEQWGMQQTMVQIGVDRFEDIMAAVSLYRPGPMKNIPDYCERKKGEAKIDYFHKSIEKFVKKHLKETYGIMIYQEQIQQICNSLAGLSIADGYVVIKAIGKKKEHLMHKYKKQFVQGCINNKVPNEIAEQYWDKYIVPFAGYGFNKSHACCYGLLSYQSCYLKANYTDEFVCAILSIEKERGNYDKVYLLEKEFQKKLNIKILPPNINKSKMTYTIETKKDSYLGVLKTEIRPSLMCKGVGYNSAENIEKNQPYKDIDEFAEKTSTTIIDTKVLESLLIGNYFGKKAKKDKERVIINFSNKRQDLKMAAKKQVESLDIF